MNLVLLAPSLTVTNSVSVIVLETRSPPTSHTLKPFLSIRVHI